MSRERICIQDGTVNPKIFSRGTFRYNSRTQPFPFTKRSQLHFMLVGHRLSIRRLLLKGILALFVPASIPSARTSRNHRRRPRIACDFAYTESKKQPTAEVMPKKKRLRRRIQ